MDPRPRPRITITELDRKRRKAERERLEELKRRVERESEAAVISDRLTIEEAELFDVGGLSPAEWAATARGDAVPARRLAPAGNLEDELAVYHAQAEADLALIRVRERRRHAQQRGEDLANLAVGFGLGILLAVIVIVAGA